MHSATGSSNLLLDASPTLQIVLSYVGPGHHLFVSFVSSVWRDVYARVESRQLTVYDEDTYSNIKLSITCVSQMTLQLGVCIAFVSSACSQQWSLLHRTYLSMSCWQAC
jgi:hypothetical protein